MALVRLHGVSVSRCIRSASALQRTLYGYSYRVHTSRAGPQSRSSHGLSEDDAIPPDTRTKLFDRIKGSALGYVSRKPYSRRDLTSKLTERFLPRSDSKSAQNYQSRFFEKEVPQQRYSKDGQHVILESIVDEVMDRFEDVHLLDDEEYAAVFARSKWRQSKWSPRKIEGELRRKGVDEDVIGAAMKSVFGEDTLLGTGMDEDSTHTFELVSLAKKQYKSYASAAISEEAKRRRLIGFLQRRFLALDLGGDAESYDAVREDADFQFQWTRAHASTDQAASD